MRIFPRRKPTPIVDVHLDDTLKATEIIRQQTYRIEQDLRALAALRRDVLLTRAAKEMNDEVPA